MAVPVEAFEEAVSVDDGVLECRAFVDGAGVYEDAGRGLVRAAGADVLDLVNRLSTNRVDHLGVGEGAPTIFTNEKGRIIDLVYVLNLGEFVLFVTGAGAQGRVMEWVDRYTFMEDSTLEDMSESMSLVTVAGPRASGVLGSATGAEVGGLEAWQSARFEGGWVVGMDVGDTPGFQVLVVDGKEALLERLLASGATLMDVEAWEAFRVGAGVPAYGKELGEGRNPLEAGLIGAIDFTKGCYIGQEVIARLDTYEKVQRALVSLRVWGSWEEGDTLMIEGRRVGEITSLAGGLGLGYVRVAEAVAGRRLEGEDGREAEVVGAPKLFGG